MRHRATGLRRFAEMLDGLTVLELAGGALDEPPHQWSGDRDHWRLALRLLRHSQHQVHRAADDLRDIALQLWQRADDIDQAAGLMTRSQGGAR